MWNPCLPGVRPDKSATIFISSPDFVNVTMPSTALPFVGWKTATALVGSPANAETASSAKEPAVSKHNPERNNRFVFIEEATAPVQGRKVLVRRKSGSLLPRSMVR